VLTIVCGLKDEADIVTRRDDVQVLWGRARSNLDQYVSRGCTRIMSFGIAGALSPTLKVGDIVLGTSVSSETETLAANQGWGVDIYMAAVKAAAKLVICRVFSSGAEVANTTDERAALYEKYDCVAVDDESIAVARFAKVNNIPFACVRAISDTTTSFLPPWVLKLTSPDGVSHFGDMLEGLAQHPQDMFSLIALGVNFHTAMDSLKKVNKALFDVAS
jgi:adenosylhomocysteine nucleosidase